MVLNILGDYRLVYARRKMSVRFPSPVGHLFILFVRICLMPEFLAVAKKLGQNVELNLHWQVGEHPPHLLQDSSPFFFIKSISQTWQFYYVYDPFSAVCSLTGPCQKLKKLGKGVFSTVARRPNAVAPVNKPSSNYR